MSRLTLVPPPPTPPVPTGPVLVIFAGARYGADKILIRMMGVLLRLLNKWYPIADGYETSVVVSDQGCSVSVHLEPR